MEFKSPRPHQKCPYYSNNYKNNIFSWGKFGAILRVFILGLALCSSALAQFAYYDDPAPRFMLDTLPVFDRGNCPAGYVSTVIEAYRQWGVVEVVLKGERRYEGYDSTFTIGCSDHMVLEQMAVPEGISYISIPVRLTQGGGAAGTTHVWWRNDTGQIVDADITLNPLWVDDSNLHRVALHETGHALGLPHSDAFESIMYPVILFGHLHVEDLARMNVLYGNCRVQVDREGNMFLPDAEVSGFEGVHQGFIDAGGVWPRDIYRQGPSECVDTQ